MTLSENPCAGCPINCCKFLKRLKLSASEYDLLFSPFNDQFVMKRKHSFFELSMNKGMSCPHLKEGGCSQYLIRPVECRLFPYTVSQTYHIGPVTLLSFHSRVPCPIRKQLLPSHSQARRLIRSLARKVYGESRHIIIVHEGIIYRLISRLQLKKLILLLKR